MTNFAETKKRETPIRVEARPSLPLDPLKIQTMADYDLTLCLYRTWFEYDVSRKAKPGVVSEWTFNSKTGSYSFKISDKATWSDGSPILAEHLLKNLKRAVDLKTSYGVAIASLINLDKAVIPSPKVLVLFTRDGRPSESFFQRMGSSFLAPIHPADWNKSGLPITNRLVSGPYKVNRVNQNQLLLERNPEDFLAPQSRPKNIEIHLKAGTDLKEFLSGRAWSTVMQTSTLMPLELASEIQEKKYPIWTRGYDRVSLLVPVGTGSTLGLRRKTLRSFGAQWAKLELGDLPLNSARAFSLQPKGYPLFDEITYQPSAPIKLTTNRNIVRIVSAQIPQVIFQKPLIEAAFKKMEMSVEWIFVESLSAAINTGKTDPSIDFYLISFGVADPEPTTWMGLVVQPASPFVSIDDSDIKEFKKLAKLNSKETEVKGFKSLIRKIGERGSYVPLFHFSTISIARHGISFEAIHELDETVDFSKIIIQ